MPGESKQVEAASDPVGLKIGIVYDAAPEGQILMYQMWRVKNESVLTITHFNGGDISTFGGQSFHLPTYLKTYPPTNLHTYLSTYLVSCREKQSDQLSHLKTFYYFMEKLFAENTLLFLHLSEYVG